VGGVGEAGWAGGLCGVARGGGATQHQQHHRPPSHALHTHSLYGGSLQVLQRSLRLPQGMPRHAAPEEGLYIPRVQLEYLHACIRACFMHTRVWSVRCVPQRLLQLECDGNIDYINGLSRTPAHPLVAHLAAIVDCSVEVLCLDLAHGHVQVDGHLDLVGLRGRGCIWVGSSSCTTTTLFQT